MKYASIFLLSFTVTFLPAMEVDQKAKRNASLLNATKNIMVIAPLWAACKTADFFLGAAQGGFNSAARIVGIDVDTILKETK